MRIARKTTCGSKSVSGVMARARRCSPYKRRVRFILGHQNRQGIGGEGYARIPQIVFLVGNENDSVAVNHDPLAIIVTEEFFFVRDVVFVLGAR